jgi:PAT family beta-lactamase induction signal transducer AmpG
MSELPRRTWRQAWSSYAHPRVCAMLFLGFSSGLPFALVLTTLSARLRQAGIDRATIGYFSLVGLAYSLKYFWSPFVDRLSLPLLGRLGRRRGWMLLTQSAIAVGLVAMALHDPAQNASTMAWLAVFTALASSSQDIVVDAYRIEAVPAPWQGAAAATYQTGYQLALICTGAGALFAAANHGWRTAYLVMAACTVVGLLTTMVIDEPEVTTDRSALAREARAAAFLDRSAHWPAPVRHVVAWLIGAIVSPFVDFFARNGLRAGLPILLLIACYRLNYISSTMAAYTFYLDMGYTLKQIALVSKVYGVAMTLLGAFAAGMLVRNLGMPRTLLLGLLLLTIANLFYAYIARMSAPGMGWLTALVGVDNVANGIAGTAFIAYMSSLTNTAYTATQYALFGTLWSLPTKAIASQWGRIVDAFGYTPFFIYTAVLGLPAVLLVLWLIRQPAAAPKDVNPA